MVRERIAAAARRAGRDPEGISLVVVTKEVGVDAIRSAIAAGATELGENRAQDLAAKAEALAGAGATWHFIGRLQRNKVRSIAEHVALWHSVDRIELGDELARRSPAARVLVQVNVAREPQKGGCEPEALAGLVDLLAERGLRVEGLMTVPPASGDPRPSFAMLRELAGPLGLRTLSMGMTGDFEQAVEEGATIVRVGSAIFGPRP